MSKLQDRQFPPRPLPLRGPDYHIKVDRDGTLRDYEIVKDESGIRIDHPFLAEDVTVRVEKDRIDVIGFQRNQDISVRKDPDGDLTVIRDAGNQYTTIEKVGNRIAIRRRDPAQEVVFTKRNDDLLIDRYGVQNDVTLKTRNGTLLIDKQGTFNDLSISLEGVGLDPVTFRNDTTLDPQAFDMLQSWFQNGLNMDDLVQVTQDGKVDVIDWLLI